MGGCLVRVVDEHKEQRWLRWIRGSKIVMWCMGDIVRDVVDQKDMWVNIKNSFGSYGHFVSKIVLWSLRVREVVD